ncbi:MAG: DHH family phosphoesterase [Thermoflexaceae bacterium]|nr:DHH family phosphoesterase [Thermoflexaceae bacterium]
MFDWKELLKNIHGKHVFIQTHNFPDPDAISSAYGMKRLLEENGIQSTICYKGKIDRYAMLRFIEYLDTAVINMEDLSDMQRTDEIILVDGQKGNSNLVDLIGNEVICIDHHPTFEQVDYRYADIRPEVGACASIVASYFFETNTPIDEKTATALIYGIKVDTANLSRSVTKLDLDMFYRLYWIGNQDVLNKLERSEIQFEDLKAYANAIRSIKIFDNISIAHTGKNCPEPLIASISDFMLALSEIDCSIVYSIRTDGIKLSIRSCDPKIDSGSLANNALKGFGSGGGHAAMAGGFIPYPKDMDSLELFIRQIEERFMEELAKIN